MNNPFAYRIDPIQGVIVVEYSEPLTVERWRQTAAAVEVDPAYSPAYGWVADLRAIHAAPPFDYVTAVVDAIAAFQSVHQKVRWARVISPEDRALYGTARMAEILMENRGLPARTFTDLDLAIQWAGESADE